MLTSALRVLDVLTRSKALNGLLGVEPHDAELLDRQAVALSLVARFPKRRSDGELALIEIQRGLAALTVLLRASRLLRAFPIQKRAFWRQVLEHPACRSLLGNGAALAHTHVLCYEDPAFPRLVLDFSHGVFFPQLAKVIADWQSSQELDESWVHEVHAVLPETNSRHVEPVTLRLKRFAFKDDDIEQLAVVLSPRRLAAANGDIPDAPPRFRVVELDLSDNGLGEGHLKSLTKVIRSADQPLDTLTLVNVVARSTSPRELRAFRSLIRAAAGLDPDSRGVRCLSLARNSFTVEHFASVCSAVQDAGSSIEELSMERTVSVYSPNNRFYAWWWLAVGLSRRVGTSTGRLRRVDLSGNPLFPRDVEMWNSTLQSPLTVMSREMTQTSTADVIRLAAHDCRLHFEPASEMKAKRIGAIADMFTAFPAGSEVSFDTLGVTDAGWVCVIVPGYGLAWVPPSSASTGATTPSAGGTNNQRQPVLVDLEIRDLTSHETLGESLLGLIESVGGSLTSLNMKRTVGPHDDEILGAILACCLRLERLDLEGDNFPSWMPLFQALAGPLRGSLRSLSLRCCRIGYISAGELASVLAGSGADPLPVLEELWLGRTHIGVAGAASMERVLQVNKRLRVLELPMPNSSASDEEYAELCSSLDDAFQDELLDTVPMPLSCKLAFLSVLLAQGDVGPLDIGVVRNIFELAAGESRRRLAYWKR